MDRMRTTTLALLVLLTACITAHATRLETGPGRPEVQADSVRVFATQAAVPRPFEEIAIIEAAGDAASTEALIKRMREEAGKLGANAIVLDAGSAGGILGADPGRRTAKCVAIYLKPTG